MSMRRSKAQRDDAAKLALQIRAVLQAKEAIDMICSTFRVSKTTARHLIRRGIFLSVNQGTK
ncbi:hypothetical protein [Bradyrhizobium elkanii]|uniref:hypothetical protein n=1 Tax=Bradyrhizobium elkanii TaxID=29448 RepID=UPI00272CDA83|nr:hypothetical protein [Bradyrhizobium elkanii]WLA80337.1 hypothetical protein QNJ99_33870 [Bradyrhizobium elkanii]